MRRVGQLAHELARPAAVASCSTACARCARSVSSTAGSGSTSTSSAQGSSSSFRRAVEPRHPAYDTLDTRLAAVPQFRTRGENVDVLFEPTQFYERLLTRIGTAKQRIFLASLYVGKEEHELVEALHTALRRNPELKVTILLDALRATREQPRASSASLVASLCAAFPGRAELRLFHTPALRGLLKRFVPRRFDEGWGLQHMKFYAFDDDIVLSGANLSKDYFTNRQDRYIEVRGQSQLVDYFNQLLDSVGSFSFRATASDTTSKHPAIDLEWPSDNIVESPLQTRSTREWHARAREEIAALTSRWAERSVRELATLGPAPRTVGNDVLDTSIRPILQMGPFDIKHETELAVPAIVRTANGVATGLGGQGTTIDWTSGYFSVQDAYKQLLLDSKAKVRIVTAAPEANGFFESAGVSRFLPPAYTYIEKKFYDETVALARRKRRAESHIDICEWRRSAWTYHAKGVWLTPSFSACYPDYISRTPLDDPDEHDLHYLSRYPASPFLTLVGSSNYGRRSAERDLEANLLVTTFSPELRRALRAEVSHLREHALTQVNDELFERKDRRVPLGVKVAATAIRTML